jgi:hypothetical protein
MALTNSYLVSVKNVRPFFDSLITAKAPENFTQKFIEGLGFKSTNDRLFISVLKGLGFLDENAVPTERYYKFLDQSESKRILADAIEEAYDELFSVNKKANELEVSEVKNKLKTLTQGKYSDKVVSLMASTFKALSEYAAWDNRDKKEKKPPTETSEDKKPDAESSNKTNIEAEDATVTFLQKPDFHYNIQIHLPDSRDESVYDAIFKSLKKHLF